MTATFTEPTWLSSYATGEKLGSAQAVMATRITVSTEARTTSRL
jgi:hypothetical protein